MLRRDHEIMLEQEDKSANIILIDKQEMPDGSLVSGTWKSSYSREMGVWNTYNDKEVVFTSVNPQYYYWEWRGPHQADINIGVKMGRASHKEGEDEIFQVLITLYNARRLATGKFEAGTLLRKKFAGYEVPLGGGRLMNNVGSDFTAGSINWTMTSYMGAA